MNGKGNDVFSAWGIYATGSSGFAVNLMMENQYIMMHVNYRPPPEENKVSLSHPTKSKKFNLLPIYRFIAI
jgi:hypothetical protein